MKKKLLIGGFLLIIVSLFMVGISLINKTNKSYKTRASECQRYSWYQFPAGSQCKTIGTYFEINYICRGETNVNTLTDTTCKDESGWLASINESCGQKGSACESTISPTINDISIAPAPTSFDLSSLMRVQSLSLRNPCKVVGGMMGFLDAEINCQDNFIATRIQNTCTSIESIVQTVNSTCPNVAITSPPQQITTIPLLTVTPTLIPTPTLTPTPVIINFSNTNCVVNPSSVVANKEEVIFNITKTQGQSQSGWTLKPRYSYNYPPVPGIDISVCDNSANEFECRMNADKTRGTKLSFMVNFVKQIDNYTYTCRFDSQWVRTDSSNVQEVGQTAAPNSNPNTVCVNTCSRTIDVSQK